MALGSGRIQIAAMILREALLTVLAGIALGIPAAMATSHLMRSQLYGLGPYDHTVRSGDDDSGRGTGLLYSGHTRDADRSDGGATLRISNQFRKYPTRNLGRCVPAVDSRAYAGRRCLRENQVKTQSSCPLRSGPNEQNCLPIWISSVRQKKEFGRASPGLLTHIRKHANLGHPYRAATTSAAAPVHCFVNLPRQVSGSR
jgi:hypothetical protein